jgi:hypothetical protein
VLIKINEMSVGRPKKLNKVSSYQALKLENEELLKNTERLKKHIKILIETESKEAETIRNFYKMMNELKQE